MSDFLDRFLERNRTAFWPWLLLVGTLALIGYLLYYEGRKAQHAIDHGARTSMHQSY